MVRLAELAQRLGAEVVGDGEREVVAVRALEEAGPEHLSFLHNTRYVKQARESGAGAIVVDDASLLPERDLLVTPQPYLAVARALELLHPVERPQPGVHPSAVVDADASIGAEVAVGPLVSIDAGSRVGDRTVIGAGCVLGRSVVVGADCWLHPGVVIEDRCRVGDRCILQSGVVIGADGYGFATVDDVHHKVPQVGVVVVEDDVEIGANTCIDRATLGETRIGRGTKIDNLVQIGHNVVIGEGSLLVSQVGLSGSTRLGHHVTMAGRSGASGHLKIGDRAILGAVSVTYKDVPDGAFMTGIPARPHREWLRDNANVKRLDALRERVKQLEREVAELQAGGGEQT